MELDSKDRDLDFDEQEYSLDFYLSSSVAAFELDPLSRQRKSHNRKRPVDHIPRPPNAFMLYRSNFFKKRIIPADIESKQQNISRVVGECWRRLTSAEQKIWKDLAKKKEEEHAKMYPDYQFKPVKRGPIIRRRKAMTREQEVEYCASLRTAYLPDKTGPIRHIPPADPPRKRKSRAKPRVPVPPQPLLHDTMVTPCGKSYASPSPSSYDCPAFMDPLIRPPSPKIQVTPPSPQCDEQFVPPPMLWMSHSRLGPELEPPIFHDFPSPTDPELEHPMVYDYPSPTEDEWQDGPSWSSHPTPSIPSPAADASMQAPPPLNVVAHIREQYDRARRTGIFPTVTSDATEAQAIFEPQPFFVAPRRTQETQSFDIPYPTLPELHHQPPFRTDCANGPAFQQPVYSHSSIYDSPFLYTPGVFSHHETASFDTLSLPMPSSSSPQRFPITIEATTPFEELHLQPPVFDCLNHSRPDLDFLTISFEETRLDQLSGNFRLEGQSVLFDEAGTAELGLGMSQAELEWSTGQMDDLLHEEVCG